MLVLTSRALFKVRTAIKGALMPLKELNNPLSRLQYEFL